MAAVTTNSSPRMTGSGLSTSRRSRESGMSARNHRSIRLVRNAVTAYAATRARASARLSSGQFEGIGDAILTGRGRTRDGDFQILPSPIANDADRHDVSDLGIRDETREVSRVFDRRAIEAHDDVAGQNAGLVGRRALEHLIDQGAFGIGELQLIRDARRQRHDLIGKEADRATPDFLILLQVVEYA